MTKKFLSKILNEFRTKDFLENSHWNDEISNNEVYFLAYQNDFIGYDYLKLKNFNNFTDTVPAYRANFKIYIKERGGFSSYQSDYPFSMVTKKGSILSALSSLCNKSADRNILFLKWRLLPLSKIFSGLILILTI